LLAFADQAAVAMENARLFESLTDQGRRLRVLAARLAEAEEMERKRLARELHDQAGQNLTALSANLEIVRMLFAECTSRAVKDYDQVIGQLYARLNDASALVKETTKRIRNVMEYLRPPALEESGLVDALEWYGIEFSSRTGVVVDVHITDTPPERPNAAIETALFRIAQEALTNVARHANASEAKVTITWAQDALTMVIADDGIGFAQPQARPGGGQHWGLISMAERAQAVGGHCRTESTPGEGTRVIVTVSL
jgi:two-component system sensor histidine kinase UhpB